MVTVDGIVYAAHQLLMSGVLSVLKGSGEQRSFVGSIVQNCHNNLTATAYIQGRPVRLNGIFGTREEAITAIATAR